MGLTWLHYGRRHASLAQHEETTTDYQDKFRTRVGQAQWHTIPSLVALLRRRHLPFPALGSCFPAKGGLLVIAP